MEEARVHPGLRRGHGAVVGAHGPVPPGEEEEAEERAGDGDPRRELPTRAVDRPRLVEGVREDLLERRRKECHPRLERRIGRGFELLEHGSSGGRGERIPRQRSGLVDGPGRCEHREHVRATAERPDRQAAADHLAEAPEVGAHPGPGGRAALAEPEAGDHLVEDEQRARRVAGRPQPVEEGVRWRHEAHVRRDRLDDHAGDPLVELGDLVVGHDHRVCDRPLGHAGGVGQAEGGDPAAPAGQQRVGVTVVAAGELHDARPPGVAARHAQRAHGRLGPGRDEADLLTPGDPRADRLGEEDLALGRCAEGGAGCRGGGDGSGDGGVRVTEDRRAVRLYVVEELVAVGVPDVRALAARHEVRMAADRAERAHR